MKCSRSPILIKLIEKQTAQVYLSRTYTAAAPGLITHSAGEHAGILERLRAHASERAIRAQDQTNRLPPRLT